MAQKLTSEILLFAYAQGLFPMASGRHGKQLKWYRPETRAVLPLQPFHMPRSLVKILRRGEFTVTVSQAFEQIIRACADSPRKDGGTWINDEIITLYSELAACGFAHSIECWRDGELKGGLYGVCIGAAFFGESMVSFAPNASKVALAHLMKRLNIAGYTLLDAQFPNPHLEQFGMELIAREEYETRLQSALKQTANLSNRLLTISDISF